MVTNTAMNLLYFFAKDLILLEKFFSKPNIHVNSSYLALSALLSLVVKINPNKSGTFSASRKH